MQECWLENECKKLHCNDEKGCLIQYKLNYLFDEANISLEQRKHIDLRLDDNNADLEPFKCLHNIEINIEDFVKSGDQLYIHSSQCGNGKTAWSLRLMQAYFKKIWLNTGLKCRGLFISVPNLLLALKDNISNKNEYVSHIKANILSCDLVIWDDIGTKSVTLFESENLFSMIDSRINAGKANIFTSNLNDMELHNALGDRLSSRICNLGYNFEFFGADKRSLKRSNK